MTYDEAMRLPTLADRSAALMAISKRPSVQLRNLISKIRVTLALKIAPMGYFD